MEENILENEFVAKIFENNQKRTEEIAGKISEYFNTFTEDLEGDECILMYYVVGKGRDLVVNAQSITQKNTHMTNIQYLAYQQLIMQAIIQDGITNE